MVQHADIDHTGVTGVSGNVATDAIFDAKGDLAVGTGANTAAKLTAGTNGFILTADSGETTGLKWAAAGGSVPTILRASPSGNVTLTSANTWYDVISLALGSAAYYQVFARGQVLVGGANGWAYLKLIDATPTAFGAGQQYSSSATSSAAPISAWGVVAGSQTIKLQAACTNAGGTAQRFPQDTTPSGIGALPITEIVAIPSTA